MLSASLNKTFPSFLPRFIFWGYFYLFGFYLLFFLFLSSIFGVLWVFIIIILFYFCLFVSFMIYNKNYMFCKEKAILKRLLKNFVLRSNSCYVEY